MRRFRSLLVLMATAALLAGCSNDDGSSPSTTTRRSTTTTSSTTTSTAPSTSASAVTTAPPGSTTTNVARPDCSSRSVLGAVPSVVAPAVGTYRYRNCSSGTVSRTVGVGAGSNAQERTIGWTAPFGTVTGLNQYGSAVVQPSATVQVSGVTIPLHCTWDNPLMIYPAGLTLNSSWRADARCEMEVRQSLQVDRSTRATGLRSFTVNGQSIRTIVLEETTDVLYVDNPRRNSTSWHTEATIFFDPARGMPVYERRISEATGQYPQKKTTTEVVLAD